MKNTYFYFKTRHFSHLSWTNFTQLLYFGSTISELSLRLRIQFGGDSSHIGNELYHKLSHFGETVELHVLEEELKYYKIYISEEERDQMVIDEVLKYDITYRAHLKAVIHYMFSQNLQLERYIHKKCMNIIF